MLSVVSPSSIPSSSHSCSGEDYLDYYNRCPEQPQKEHKEEFDDSSISSQDCLEATDSPSFHYFSPENYNTQTQTPDCFKRKHYRYTPNTKFNALRRIVFLLSERGKAPNPEPDPPFVGPTSEDPFYIRGPSVTLGQTVKQLVEKMPKRMNVYMFSSVSPNCLNDEIMSWLERCDIPDCRSREYGICGTKATQNKLLKDTEYLLCYRLKPEETAPKHEYFNAVALVQHNHESDTITITAGKEKLVIRTGFTQDPEEKTSPYPPRKKSRTLSSRS